MTKYNHSIEINGARGRCLIKALEQNSNKYFKVLKFTKTIVISKFLITSLTKSESKPKSVEEGRRPH